MKINPEKLLKALDKVKGGLPSESEKVPHFIFHNNNIIAYNYQACVIYPFEFETEKGFAVPADEFYKIISKLKNLNEVDLTVKDAKLKIKGKGINGQLSCIFDDTDMFEFIDILDLESEKKYKKLPKDFIEGLKMCMFSASKDQSQLALGCLFIDGAFIASTDDVRITDYEMKDEIDDSFLIPLRSVNILVNFDMTEYFADESWIYFTNGDIVFCCRMVNEEFPQIEEFFEFDGVDIKLPDSLKEYVETAAIMSDGTFDIDQNISVKISKDKINVRGEKDIGWIETSTDIKLDIENDIEFIINPIFFKTILDKTNIVRVGENRALFSIGDNFRHLVALPVNE